MRIRSVLIAALSAGFCAAQSTCLSGGIASDVRKSVVDGQAVQLATYSWESSRITTSIARIILEERMGIEVNNSAVLRGSHLGPPALAGGTMCVADNNFRDCDVNSPTSHFVFDAWGGGEKSYNLMNSTIQPIIGPMGYMGREGTFVPDSALQSGLARTPAAFLDFYKSYNSSVSNLTHFMASRATVQAKIDELGLVKAKCTREEIPQAHAGCSFYEEATGDRGLYSWTEDAEGQLQCNLICDDDWIMSPACRQNPDSCVAWVSTGDGWGVEEMLQQAVFWNIALAVVVLPGWGDYTTLPLEVPSLWFWFFPDPSFMALDPTRLQEPPTDHGERAARIYRTGADAIVLHKFQWKLLPTFAPQVSEFLHNVEFSRADIVELMTNASRGQALDDIACAWTRQQEARWASWLPQPDLCAAGWAYDEVEGRCTRCAQGMFSTGPGSPNTTCQLCPAGSFGNELGASECRLCSEGNFAAGEGQTSCVSCESGTYGDVAGLAQCKACREGSDAALWTTMKRIVVQGTERWVPIDGAVSFESCGCDEGARWRDGLNGTDCIPCSTEGMRCIGMGDVIIEDGYMSDLPLSVFECFGDPRRCSGGVPGETCKPGRLGIACSECEEGKTPADDGSCTECQGNDTLPAVAGVLAGVLCLCTVYLMVDRRVGNTAAPSQVVLMASIAFGQLISVVQQLSVVALFAVNYDEPVGSFVRIFTVFAFNVQLFRIGCVSSVSAVGRYVVKVGIFFSTVIIMFVCHILSVLILHKRQFQQRKAVLVAAIAVIMMALFTSIVVVVVGPFQCNKHPNGKYSMAAYEDIICWDFDNHDEQTTMLAISAFAILGPLLFFGRVCHLVYVLPERMRVLDTAYMKTYGIVFLRFRPGAQWYLVVLTTRSLLIALIPIIRDAVTQIFILQGLLLLTQAICFIAKPWRVNKMNYLDALFTLGMLLFSNLAAFSVEDVNTQGVGYLIVAVMIGCLLTVPALFAYVLYRKFGPIPKQFQYFLCHAKAEAGCFSRLLKMELMELPQVKREVFLDADNLDDLDKLLSYVGHDLDTLLVLLSKSTLHRAWCAGEVTVAKKHHVNTLPVEVPGYEKMDAEQLEKYVDSVTGLEVLVEAGLSPEMVLQAVTRVTNMEKILLPMELHPQHARLLAQMVASGKVSGALETNAIGKVGKGSVASIGSCATRSATAAILADCSSLEALASASIIKRLVAPKVMHMERSRQMEIVLETDEEILPPETKIVILVGTNGSLLAPGVVLALFVAAERTLQVLPVVCEDQFNYPTVQMFTAFSEESLPTREDGSVRTREDVVALMQDVFKEIAVVMRTRSSSRTLLDVAANEAANRILSQKVHAVKASSTLKSGEISPRFRSTTAMSTQRTTTTTRTASTPRDRSSTDRSSTMLQASSTMTARATGPPNGTPPTGSTKSGMEDMTWKQPEPIVSAVDPTKSFALVLDL